MAVETAQWIDQLVPGSPENSAPISEGDDQFRLIKKVLQDSWIGKDWADITGTDVGSADEYHVALTGSTLSAENLLFVRFLARSTSEAGCSFKLNNNSPVRITHPDNTLLSAGDIVTGMYVCIAYIASSQDGAPSWQLLNGPRRDVLTALINQLKSTQPATGAIQSGFFLTAPSGWIPWRDGTIGNASSGASIRANSDTEALFSRWWSMFGQDICPVSGGRQTTAAQDFASNKRIQLPPGYGRTIGVAGAASNPADSTNINPTTARAVGAFAGSETSESSGVPPHTHDFMVFDGDPPTPPNDSRGDTSEVAGNWSDNPFPNSRDLGMWYNQATRSFTTPSTGPALVPASSPTSNAVNTKAIAMTGAGISTTASNTQPTIFLLHIIKL